MKKIIFLFLCVLSANIFAFDWPQNDVIQSDKFYSYFGQLRGGTISSSLIFSEPSEIKAAEEGEITIIITEYEDYSDFFPSTLGNAVIISHKDKLMTVYGNIDSQSLLEQLFENRTVESGTSLGFSGNSAWQQGRSSLEFQVIDVNNNTAINPRVLMPRIGKELPLYYNEIFLKGKNGTLYPIATQNVLPAGLYHVYKKRQPTAMPYKTRYSINGTLVDSISFDVLRQNENQLCASGKKNYPKEIMYPKDDLMLLGEATLTPGKNTLQFMLIDILGKETAATYSVSIY